MKKDKKSDHQTVGRKWVLIKDADDNQEKHARLIDEPGFQMAYRKIDQGHAVLEIVKRFLRPSNSERLELTNDEIKDVALSIDATQSLFRSAKVWLESSTTQYLEGDE